MFFIPAAHAQAAPTSAGDPMMSFAFMIGIFALFYFIAIRPQRKRQKEHQDMLGKLAVRDEVATASGILGRITAIEQDFVVLKVADTVEIKIQKWAVQNVLPKGTLKGVGAAGEKK
ncbi:MAG: Sec translocon accessory complex subunit YajC [Pseudomonadales bacterium]|nr:Sec translocon accessory complex subunit YajC [Pseudomonadales bacterium]